MRLDYLRFGMAGVFLCVSAVLFLRNIIAPDFFARLQQFNLWLGAWFALVLAGWNAARGYMEWMSYKERQTPVRLPFQHERETSNAYERNPELDFFKIDEPGKNLPSPSVNGDHDVPK